MKSIEYSSDVTFDGEGSYFGKQVTISKDTNYRISNYGFEIAYSDNHIRVYTSNHHGFQVPEFIDLYDKDEDFKELKELLNTKLKELLGLT